MIKRNSFLNAALEELQQGIDVSAVPTTGAAADPTTTQTDVNSDTDAVASLMEKNTELEDTNATLESEVFDNDTDAIQTVSDSVSEDLDEAVAAGIALEELAYIANLTARTGQANKASIASLVFAFEQITDRVNIPNAVAALEDGSLVMHDGATDEGAKAQAEGVGAAAKEKAQTILKKLAEGIKRIIGWLINTLRQIFTRFGDLTKRISAAAAQLDSIDESKTIDSKPFIASLRLVEGAGDPDKQFSDYVQLANKTLYGFFNRSFTENMVRAFNAIKTDTNSQETQDAGAAQLVEVLRTVMSVIFTEHGDIRDVSGSVPSGVDAKDLTVGKTKPCVGGGQLYLAATLDGSDQWYCRSGLAKTQPTFATPDNIPVADKNQADKVFKVITTWIQHERDLTNNLTLLITEKWMNRLTGGESIDAKMISKYMAVLTALATSVIPQFMRLNSQNAINYVTYVEKSIAVSKASYATK